MDLIYYNINFCCYSKWADGASGPGPVQVWLRLRFLLREGRAQWGRGGAAGLGSVCRNFFFSLFYGCSDGPRAAARTGPERVTGGLEGAARTRIRTVRDALQVVAVSGSEPRSCPDKRTLWKLFLGSFPWRWAIFPAAEGLIKLQSIIDHLYWSCIDQDGRAPAAAARALDLRTRQEHVPAATLLQPIHWWARARSQHGQQAQVRRHVHG